MNTFQKSTLEKFNKILRLKNYSERTIEIYSFYILKFYELLNKEVYQLNIRDLNEYLYNYKYTSISQQNQIINSLKLFYKYILNKRDIHLNKIERPRKEKHLPRVIDKEFILNKINNIGNLKHKSILALGFSVGLRVSEVCNLKITDIDSKRMLIIIHNGKGKKDRIVPLTDTVLEILRAYYKEYIPNEYLFQGQFGGRYSTRSCEQLIKKYIDKNSGYHLLRHSSFTSMIESGTDIRIIQKIAGHNSLKTTEIYTHISNECMRFASMPI
jgi:site-specific recombinase XerD